MTMQVFVSNTNMLELFRLRSEVEGVYIEDASVDVTITDDAGVDVLGQTWPLTLSFISGSDGDYYGILSEDIEFTPNTTYVAIVDANAGVNRVGHWEVPFVPRIRNQ